MPCSASVADYQLTMAENNSRVDYLGEAGMRIAPSAQEPSASIKTSSLICIRIFPVHKIVRLGRGQVGYSETLSERSRMSVFGIQPWDSLILQSYKSGGIR